MLIFVYSIPWNILFWSYAQQKMEANVVAVKAAAAAAAAAVSPPPATAAIADAPPAPAATVTTPPAPTLVTLTAGSPRAPSAAVQPPQQEQPPPPRLLMDRLALKPLPAISSGLALSSLVSPDGEGDVPSARSTDSFAAAAATDGSSGASGYDMGAVSAAGGAQPSVSSIAASSGAFAVSRAERAAGVADAPAALLEAAPVVLVADTEAPGLQPAATRAAAAADPGAAPPSGWRRFLPDPQALRKRLTTVLRKAILTPPIIAIMIGIVVGVAAPLRTTFFTKTGSLTSVGLVITQLGSPTIPLGNLLLGASLFSGLVDVYARFRRRQIELQIHQMEVALRKALGHYTHSLGHGSVEQHPAAADGAAIPPAATLASPPVLPPLPALGGGHRPRSASGVVLDGLTRMADNLVLAPRVRRSASFRARRRTASGSVDFDDGGISSDGGQQRRPRASSKAAASALQASGDSGGSATPGLRQRRRLHHHGHSHLSHASAATRAAAAAEQERLAYEYRRQLHRVEAGGESAPAFTIGRMYSFEDGGHLADVTGPGAPMWTAATRDARAGSVDSWEPPPGGSTPMPPHAPATTAARSGVPRNPLVPPGVASASEGEEGGASATSDSEGSWSSWDSDSDDDDDEDDDAMHMAPPVDPQFNNPDAWRPAARADSGAAASSLARWDPLHLLPRRVSARLDRLVQEHAKRRDQLERRRRQATAPPPAAGAVVGAAAGGGHPAADAASGPAAPPALHIHVPGAPAVAEAPPAAPAAAAVALAPGSGSPPASVGAAPATAGKQLSPASPSLDSPLSPPPPPSGISVRTGALLIFVRLIICPLILFPLFLAAERAFGAGPDNVLRLIILINSAVPSAQSVVLLAQLNGNTQAAKDLGLLYVVMYPLAMVTLTIALVIAMAMVFG